MKHRVLARVTLNAWKVAKEDQEDEGARRRRSAKSREEIIAITRTNDARTLPLLPHCFLVSSGTSFLSNFFRFPSAYVFI